MIEKDDLLKRLEKCRALEERTIPLYGQHLSDPSFLPSFATSEQNEVKELLLRLAREAGFHEETYRDLIRSVAGAAQNAF